MKIRSLFPVLALVLGGCATGSFVTAPPGQVKVPSALETEPADEIRVAIIVGESSVHLAAPASFTLSGFPTGTPVIREKDGSYYETTLTPDELYAPNTMVEPLGEGQVQVNGRNFQGSLEILKEPGGILTVVNQLSLEDYVMGVLAGEIPHNWPLEALKAQAIAARTFAVFQRFAARQKGAPYDLEGTAQFQRYQGSDLVNDKIRQAVLETRGRIITYDSKPIEAFFHSNCGGETCGADGVWSHDKPYLRPVKCPFGNNGAHFRWKAEVPIGDLVRKLREAGVPVGDIVRLEATARDESNRVLELSITDTDGSVKTMKGSAFRTAVGPDIIRSTRFAAIVGPASVVFNGKGWGHGVGMCQEGACGMALKGYNAFEILRYYYRGVMIEDMKNYVSSDGPSSR